MESWLEWSTFERSRAEWSTHLQQVEEINVELSRVEQRYVAAGDVSHLSEWPLPPAGGTWEGLGRKGKHYWNVGGGGR